MSSITFFLYESHFSLFIYKRSMYNRATIQQLFLTADQLTAQPKLQPRSLRLFGHVRVMKDLLGVVDCNTDSATVTRCGHNH